MQIDCSSVLRKRTLPTKDFYPPLFIIVLKTTQLPSCPSITVFVLRQMRSQSRPQRCDPFHANLIFIKKNTLREFCENIWPLLLPTIESWQTLHFLSHAFVLVPKTLQGLKCSENNVLPVLLTGCYEKSLCVIQHCHTSFIAGWHAIQKQIPYFWHHPTLDSSVGRAEDCRWFTIADILRSLVQIRLEGHFFLFSGYEMDIF